MQTGIVNATLCGLSALHLPGWQEAVETGISATPSNCRLVDLFARSTNGRRCLSKARHEYHQHGQQQPVVDQEKVVTVTGWCPSTSFTNYNYQPLLKLLILLLSMTNE